MSQSSPSSRPPAVIFDWDGTLMDSIGLIVSSMQHAARRAGAIEADHPLTDRAEQKAIRATIGLSLGEAISQLYPSHPEVWPLIEEYYADHYVHHVHDQAMFPEAADLLKRLRQRGYQVAIATGKTRASLDRALKQTGFTDFFDTTICADEGAVKPDPAMLYTVLDRLQVSPSQAVMIGDSRMDMEMGRAAAVKPIGVAWGAQTAPPLGDAGAPVVAQNFSELEQMIEGALLPKKRALG